jgi:hypothetical protein
MAAFGESCRGSGHVFSSLFDPLLTLQTFNWCIARDSPSFGMMNR